nr:hypothetical protein [Candidatus Nanopelagicales bacterium]
MTLRSRRPSILLSALALLAGLALVPLASAQAAPCPWGTQCNAVTMVAPTSGAVLAGTVPLEATARQTTPDRGSIVKVEWWLYH